MIKQIEYITHTRTSVLLTFFLEEGDEAPTSSVPFFTLQVHPARLQQTLSHLCQLRLRAQRKEGQTGEGNGSYSRKCYTIKWISDVVKITEATKFRHRSSRLRGHRSGKPKETPSSRDKILGSSTKSHHSNNHHFTRGLSQTPFALTTLMDVGSPKRLKTGLEKMHLLFCIFIFNTKNA